jgi:polyhydroxyalkanoate synthesis repressor PhaR
MSNQFEVLATSGVNSLTPSGVGMNSSNGSMSAGSSTQPNHPTSGVSKNNSKTKIIKRYQNRKLYDTQQSCYVTLDDIAKMIRVNEDVMVIDNKSKNDITAATLTQIIFEAEKKASQYAPLFTLREIIQNANGSISSYLAKLGAFPKEYAVAQPAPLTSEKSAHDEIKQSLENRVAKAAADTADYSSKTGRFETEETPSLPTSNKSFSN